MWIEGGQRPVIRTEHMFELESEVLPTINTRMISAR